MRAIILSIGDELTLGQTPESNSQWLSAALAERSIITVEHRTLADDRAALAAAIGECAPRCELLIITGGLGPTEDDLTREAVGDAVAPGDGLVEDAAASEHLNAWFTRRGRSMPAMNLKQALRPRTFRSIPNPHGTAPGLVGEYRGCMIFCLPGPPREMQSMFTDRVLAALPSPLDGDVMLTGAVHEFGMGESVAAEKLGDLMQRDRNPLLGTTVSQSIVTGRIRVRGNPTWARQQMDETIARLRDLWHPYAFAEGDGSLSQAVGGLLLKRRLRLATAESCTGGALGKSIVDRPGSSAYYLGGWVTYSNALKTSCLGVDADMLERLGAVSGDVAGAMARGALNNAGADCALAITGIAGPDGGTPQKPVGTAFVAAAVKAAALVPPLSGDVGALRCFVRRFEFPGDRESVRDRSVKSALQLLRFILMGVVDTPLLWEASRSGATASQSKSPAEVVAR